MKGVAVFPAALGENNAVGIVGIDGGTDREGAVGDLGRLGGVFFMRGFFVAGLGENVGGGVDSFGPSFPVFDELVFDDAVVFGDVILLRAIFGKVVELPSDFERLTFAPDEFPVALAEASGFLVFEGEDAIWDGFGIGNGREERGSFDGADFVAVALGGILSSSCFKDGGDDVHEVGRSLHIFLGGFDAFWPVEDEGRGDPAFVAEVFVHAQRGVTEIGPAGPVGGVGIGLANVGEVIACVESGGATAGAAIESEGTPLVAGSVVREKGDDGVVEFVILFEIVENAANSLVNVLDHGGEGGHAAGEIFAAVGGEVGPFGVGFAGEMIGDVISINGDFGKGREFGVGADEAELLLALEALAPEDVPPLAVGFHMAVNGFLGGLDGKVRGGMCEVKEPGFFPPVFFSAGLFEELESVVGENISDVEVFGDGEFGLG